MAAAIVLSVFWASAILAAVWLIGGGLAYFRYIPAAQQRNERLMWFIFGPLGPMLFAYMGWEERHKIHGPVMDSIFRRRKQGDD